MMFMQFGIGSDMALCLIRAIILSLFGRIFINAGAFNAVWQGNG